MKATKSNFVMTARIIREARAKHGTAYPAVEAALHSMAIEFADEFGRHNENFNRALFLGACRNAEAS